MPKPPITAASSSAARPDSTVISQRIPRELLADVDQLAESEGRTRSNMILRLIEKGLEFWSHGKIRSFVE